MLKRNPFYLVLPPFSFSCARCNKDGIIAGRVDRIVISDKYEIASSGNEEDAMFSGDTNSDSSLSELTIYSGLACQ